MAITNEGFIGVPTGAVGGGGGVSWDTPATTTPATSTPAVPAVPVAVSGVGEAVADINKNVGSMNQYTQNVATQAQTVAQKAAADKVAADQKAKDDADAYAKQAAATAQFKPEYKPPTAEEIANQLLLTAGGNVKDTLASGAEAQTPSNVSNVYKPRNLVTKIQQDPNNPNSYKEVQVDSDTGEILDSHLQPVLDSGGRSTFFAGVGSGTAGNAQTAEGNANAAAQQALGELNDKTEQAHKDFQTATQQMLNGTFPLNDDQKAQLSNLQKQFEGLKQQQLTANQNFTTGITQAGIAAGRSRYAPEVELGNIQSSVNLGLQKIADLDQKMSDAMNTMKRAFQTDNYKLLADANTEMQNYEQKKYENIRDMAKDIQDRKDALTKQNQAIAEADKTRQATLDKNLSDLMQTASGSGANDATIAAMSKAKSLTEAIQIGGTFVKDTTASLNAQIKEATLAKTKAQTAKLTGTTASAAAALGLDDSAVNFYAQSIAAGGTMPTLGMGANAVLVKAAIMNQAAKIAIDNGMTGNAYVLKQKSLAASSAALKQQTTQLAATQTAEKKANYTLDLALKVAPNVWRSGIPIVNRFEQWAAGKTLAGDPNLVQFENHIYEATSDYAKVISGSAASSAGLSDSARKEAQNLISASMSPDQFKAAVDAMKQNMVVTNQSYEDTINDLKYDVMGLDNALPTSTTGVDNYSGTTGGGSSSYTAPNLNNITNPADAF